MAPSSEGTSGCRDGTVVRVLASHQCGLGSIPDSASYVDRVCWFCTLHWKVFVRSLRFSPLRKNQHLLWFDLLISVYSFPILCSSARTTLLRIWTEWESGQENVNETTVDPMFARWNSPRWLIFLFQWGRVTNNMLGNVESTFAYSDSGLLCSQP